MTTYTAPVDDMMFLFEKLRNNKNYNELDKYKEITPEIVKYILVEAAKLNQNIILSFRKLLIIVLRLFYCTLFKVKRY